MTPSRKSLSRRLALLAAVALIAFAVIGILVVPPILRWQFEKQLAELTQRQVTVGNVRFDPFRLKLGIDELQIARRPGERDASSSGALLRVRQIEARASWQTLIQFAPVISSVRIEAPELRFARDSAGRYDFDDLLQRWLTRQPADPNAPVARFSVANIELNDGRIQFDDAPPNHRHRIDGLKIGVPFISSLAIHQAIHVEPALAAKVNGSPLALTGKSLPFSPDRASTLELRLDDIDVLRYLGYVPSQLPVKVARGRFSFASVIEFSQPPGKKPRVAMKGQASLVEPSILERDGSPLFEANSITVSGLDLEPFESSYTVAELKLEAPRIVVHRRATDPRWFASLTTSAASQPTTSPASQAAVPSATSAPAASKPVHVQWSVGHFQMRRGVVDFRDEQFRPRTLAMLLQNVSIDVDGLSSDLKSPVRYQASHDTASNEASSVKGELRLEPFETSGEASVERIKLPAWWWIAEPYVTFDLIDGESDSSVRYKVAVKGEQADVQLSDMQFRVRRLALRQRSDQLIFLKLPEATTTGARFDLAGQHIGLGRIEAHGATLEVRREADGKFNLAKLVPRPQSASTAPAAAGRPWIVTLDRLAATSHTLNYRDAIAGRAADGSLTEFEVNAEALSTEVGKTGRIAASTRINREGRLKLGGPLSLEPLSSSLKLELSQLGLTPVQPFMPDQLNAVLRQGRAQAQGELRLGVAAQGRRAVNDSAAPGVPRPGSAFPVAYRGSLAFLDVDIEGRQPGEALTRFSRLAITGLEVVSDPLKAQLGGIALDDLRLRVVRGPQGQLNLANVWRTDASNTSRDSTQATAGGADISLNKLTLARAAVDLYDQAVQPEFRGRLGDLSGEITAMSSNQNGQLQLKGSLNRTGAIEAKGTLNPLSPNFFVDGQLKLADVELPAFSAYAGKYIGREIDRGKFSADLTYKIENRKLDAANIIRFDQFELGKTVESADAISAPVGLAVSLLKDRHGVINIDLPVTGTLDDPKFSIWGLVWQVLGNLIVKAVTSPFALIAGLAGGGEADLSTIDFEAGQLQIEPTASAQLRTLATALAERPGLSLDITGRSDPQTDRKAIQERRASKGPEVTDADLQALADRRAAAVKQWLQEEGKIPGERLFIVPHAGDTSGHESGARRVELKLK